METTVFHRRCVALLAAASLTLGGCLGVFIEAPTATERTAYTTLRWHLIAAPRAIDASVCPNGLSQITTFVPLWGLVVGFFTIGILVPQWTTIACVAR